MNNNIFMRQQTTVAGGGAGLGLGSR